MSSLPAVTPFPSQNPFESARLKLIERLSTLVAPRDYSLFPKAGEHDTVADHVREAVDVFNDWIRAVGDEIQANAVTAIDGRTFDRVFSDAADDAVYCLSREAETLREGREAA